MEYDFLCVTGLIIVAILMLPNILYALHRPGVENKCENKPLLVLEQLGRYGCILLMILPLGISTLPGLITGRRQTKNEQI